MNAVKWFNCGRPEMGLDFLVCPNDLSPWQEVFKIIAYKHAEEKGDSLLSVLLMSTLLPNANFDEENNDKQKFLSVFLEPLVTSINQYVNQFKFTIDFELARLRVTFDSPNFTSVSLPEAISFIKNYRAYPGYKFKFSEIVEAWIALAEKNFVSQEERNNELQFILNHPDISVGEWLRIEAGLYDADLL